MAFGHGSNARVIYNLIDVSPYIESIEPVFNRKLDPIKPLSQDWVSQVAGQLSCMLTLAGIYEPSTDALAEEAWAALGASTENVWAYMPRGHTTGYEAFCGQSRASKNEIPASDGPVRYPVAVVGSKEADYCIILHALGEETDDGNGTTQNAGAETETGGAGYLVCTAIESGATLDVVIEHSDNGADWSTLITFSQLSAAGNEVVELGATAEVKQYTRTTWDLSEGASDDATFFVALGRR